MLTPTGTYTEDSVENALLMMGTGYDHPAIVIEPSRKNVVRRKGKMVEEDTPAWVKFSTGFKAELKDLGEYALKVFIYVGLSIGFETGSSHPGIRKIAEDTGMSQNTAIKAVKELEEKGFMVVERREKASNIYVPTRYISVGKSASPNEAVEDEERDNLPHEDANLPHQNDNLPHDSRVKLLNKIELDKQELYDSANHTVDKILELNLPSVTYWKGRELFRDNHLSYADWYNGKTGQVPGKRFQRAWKKAFTDWQDEGLSISDLEQARVSRLKWKEFIGDPNELTKDAAAIKAQSILFSVPLAVTGSSTGYYA